MEARAPHHHVEIFTDPTVARDMIKGACQLAPPVESTARDSENLPGTQEIEAAFQDSSQLEKTSKPTKRKNG